MQIITVRKAWGTERWLVNSELYCCKELRVDPGWQASLHRHKIKTESFIVRRGEVLIEIDGAHFIGEYDDVFHIPPGVWHRFGSHTGAMLLEISTHHSDSDVERVEPSRRIDA